MQNDFTTGNASIPDNPLLSQEPAATSLNSPLDSQQRRTRHPTTPAPDDMPMEVYERMQATPDDSAQDSQQTAHPPDQADSRPAPIVKTASYYTEGRVRLVARKCYEMGLDTVIRRVAPKGIDALDNIGKHVTDPIHGTKNKDGNGDGYRFEKDFMTNGTSFSNSDKANAFVGILATVRFLNGLSSDLDAAMAIDREPNILGKSSSQPNTTNRPPPITTPPANKPDGPPKWRKLWKAASTNGTSEYLDSKKVGLRNELRYGNDRGKPFVLIPMFTRDGE